MTELAQLLFLFYGVVLGAKHALEPDHLAAVSTMAAHGRSKGEIVRLSSAWGAGHASLVAAIGTLLILLPWEAPAWLESRAEAIVGLMMVAMGCYVLWNIRRGELHVHRHGHDGKPDHSHFHLHRSHNGHDHPGEPWWMSRPSTAFMVGSVHGLAGSGAAIALAVAAAPSTASAVLYLLLFALGSIAGMAAMGLLALWPIVLVSSRSLRSQRLIQTLAGGISVVIGLQLIYATFV
jgi:ABC-type nickel/cobalt efflux system permease component RcnA